MAFIKYLIRFVCALSLFFLSPNAMATETKKGAYTVADFSKEMLLTVLNSPRTVDGTMALLQTAEMPTESIKIIESDLKKRLPKPIPRQKYMIQKDELFVNNRSTGIKILSYWPAKIQYRGQIWTMKQSLPADENYRSFMNLFDRSGRSNASWDVFLPQVYADSHDVDAKSDSLENIELVSGRIGMVAAFAIIPKVLVALGLVPATIAASTVIGAVALCVGALAAAGAVGYLGFKAGQAVGRVTNEARSEYVITKFLNTKPDVVCSRDEMTFQFGSTPWKLVIDKLHHQIIFQDEDGEDNSDVLTPNCKAELESMAENCPFTAKAKEVVSDYQNRQRTLAQKLGKKLADEVHSDDVKTNK